MGRADAEPNLGEHLLGCQFERDGLQSGGDHLGGDFAGIVAASAVRHRPQTEVGSIDEHVLVVVALGAWVGDGVAAELLHGRSACSRCRVRGVQRCDEGSAIGECIQAEAVGKFVFRLGDGWAARCGDLMVNMVAILDAFSLVGRCRSIVRSATCWRYDLCGPLSGVAGDLW